MYVDVSIVWVLKLLLILFVISHNVLLENTYHVVVYKPADVQLCMYVAW